MVEVNLIKSYFMNEDGSLDKDSSLLMAGHFAGVCYNEEGYDKVSLEDVEKTLKRVKMTKENGHHSVYDHIYMTLNIKNVPKILAMVLNNEKEYTTSEKSARYVKLNAIDTSVISQKEIDLYNKWNDKLHTIIESYYHDVFPDRKIRTLSQENARYFITVFMPTTFVYTTSLRQINYIVSWMQEYINNHDKNDFSEKLSSYMQEFINELERLNILDKDLMRNEKNRHLSLFGKDLDKKSNYFGDVYSTVYKGSFAELAQLHRHRTIHYQMEFLKDKEFFVPAFLDKNELRSEWLSDMQSVGNIYPQGQLINVYERGCYEDFILKCKERLCSNAQYEIMLQTKKTLSNFLIKSESEEIKKDIEKYIKGARCTFPDFTCTSCCNYKDGMTLKRKI